MNLIPLLFISLSGLNITLPDPHTVQVDVHVTSSHNVKRFGATGDARKLTDAVITNGSGVITSATGAFSDVDVGKMIWGINSVGTVVLPVGTITAINSPTSLTASTSGVGTWSGISLVLGTDDTAALIAASKAADAATPRGNITVPAGGFIFTQTPFTWTNSPYQFRRPSITGEGSSHTHFYPMPGAELSNGCILNFDTINGTTNFSGFTLDGSNATFTGSQALFISSSANYNLLTDIRVQNFTGLLCGIGIAGGAVMDKCHVESIWGGRGIYTSGHLRMMASYAGNCGYFSLDATNATVDCIGCTLDESTGGTVQLTNSTGRFTASLVYAGGSFCAATVHGTSILHGTASQFIPFDVNPNSTGVKILSGGKAYLQGCQIKGSGTGHGLNNEGTVYDGGNNESNSKTGAGTITTLTL